MVPDGLIFGLFVLYKCACMNVSNFLYTSLKAEDEFAVFVYSSTSPKVTLRYTVQPVDTVYCRESFHPMLCSKCQFKLK